MSRVPSCVACGRTNCREKITGAELDRRVHRSGQGERLCEYPECHYLAAQDKMFLLFRECWYCPEHAKEELEAAKGERALTPEEAQTLERLA